MKQLPALQRPAPDAALLLIGEQTLEGWLYECAARARVLMPEIAAAESRLRQLYQPVDPIIG